MNKIAGIIEFLGKETFLFLSIHYKTTFKTTNPIKNIIGINKENIILKYDKGIFEFISNKPQSKLYAVYSTGRAVTN